MQYLRSLLPGTRAIATDKATTMGSQLETKEARQQATRGTTPITAPTADSVTSLDTAHEDMQLDYTNEKNEGHITKQVAAQWGPSHSQRQFKSSARPSGPSNIQEQESSRWQELPDKVDTLSAHMRSVQIALKELQQDKHEKIALQKDLEEAQYQLKQATLSLDNVRKNWKKAASQLDQLRSQGTGLYQLPDSDLISSVKKLRYDIRNFSVRYFSGKAPEQSRNPRAGKFWNYMLDITPGSHDYEAYLKSETKRPIVIQSFLWRLLVGEVAEHFYWIPDLYKPMAKVYQALHSVVGDDFDRKAPTYPETERRFQMWKATTTALIMEYIRDTDDDEFQKDDKRFICKFSQMALEVMSSFVRNSHNEVLNDLIHIIESFIALDQEIFRQAARIYWRFPKPDNVHFNPEFMAVEQGEVSPQPGQQVSVVMAPALVKRGKSSGENFETENILLKMDVTCVVISRGSRSDDGHMAR